MGRSRPGAGSHKVAKPRGFELDLPADINKEETLPLPENLPSTGTSAVLEVTDGSARVSCPTVVTAFEAATPRLDVVVA